MALLGIILIIIAILGILVGLRLATSNSEHLNYSAWGLHLDLSPVLLFLAGMALIALLWLGWWMIRAGARRGLDKRRERKQLRHDAHDKDRQLKETQEELEREREERAVAQEKAEHQERRADRTERVHRSVQDRDMRAGDENDRLGEGSHIDRPSSREE